MKIVEKGFLLSFAELTLLLYVKGVRRINGIHMPPKTYSDAEMVQLLHQLVKRGAVAYSGGKFMVCSELDRILAVMGNPEHDFILQGPSGQQQYYCYCTGNEVVVSEQYWKKPSTVKLRLFSYRQFLEWKEEVGYDSGGGRIPDDGAQV